MDRLSEQTHRMFARVDAVLEAIENGEDPRPAARRLEAATPWDVIALGHAFVLDVIEREHPGRSPWTHQSIQTTRPLTRYGSDFPDAQRH